MQEEANKEEELGKQRELEEAKRQGELRLKELEEQEANRLKATQDAAREEEIRKQKPAEDARA